MNTQLYIPDKIKVGYNKREDTYSKKLAYVIYYDQKGVLRKETSWKNWIQEEMGIDDFDNVPTDGFVLNKGVGGTRESYGWNARNEYIRVYDPRGFEFEISVANLLWILQECTSIKGKGLVGEFVYSWEGKELVLLPVDTMEYKNCQSFTKLQSGKITAKDLEPGSIYMDSKQKKLIYLGKYDYYEHYIYSYTEYNNPKPSKKYIFTDVETGKTITSYSGLNSIKERITTNIVDGYADMLSYFLDETTYLTTFKEFRYDNITEEDLKNKSYRLTLYQNGKVIEIYSRNGNYETYNYSSYRSNYTPITIEDILQLKKRIIIFNNGLEIISM
jgi:hypothetical protein